MNKTTFDNSPDTATQDPAAIEQDIRRTQEDMSRTVDQIGTQLTFRNVVDSLLDRADQNNVDTQYLIDGARRNPIALGLIAAGAIWLVSDKDSKFPSRPKMKWKSRDSDEDYSGDIDVHHRDYVQHMSTLDMREGEDPVAYQRRRDLHRANFLMCERNYDEDDNSFRQRLDSLTDKFREKRQAWSDSASNAGTATREKGRMAVDRASEMYEGNPLVGGIIAAAVGAALGTTVPISRQEQEKLGSVGAKAREVVSEQKDQLTEQAREKKDELLLKADEKLQPSGSSEPAIQGGPSGSTPTGTAPSQPEAPFIISDRTS